MPSTQLQPRSWVLRLPLELLDQILSLVDLRSDLESFKEAFSIDIPEHLEYRVVRIRHILPKLWVHLARRTDLSRNIRELHICNHDNRTAPDLVPSTLIDAQLDEVAVMQGSERADPVYRMVVNMCQAIQHMKNLELFAWECRPSHQYMQRDFYEEAILRVLAQSSSLKHLLLAGDFGRHLINEARFSQYPVWKIENLTSLSLKGHCWAKRDFGEHMVRWLHKSPSLKHLEIPLEFLYLDDLHLPVLETLKLMLDSGTHHNIDESRSQFLENHPTIQNLFWAPVGPVSLSSRCLPNLRRVRIGIMVLGALEDAHRLGIREANSNEEQKSEDTGEKAIEVVTSNLKLALPPSESPLSGGENARAPLGATLLKERKRRIESLEASDLTPPRLFSLTMLDRLSLKHVRFPNIDDIDLKDNLPKVAEAFPNIIWLELPTRIFETTGWSVARVLEDKKDFVRKVKKEEWLSLLPLFRNLHTFRGLGLWETVDYDPSAMHDLIIELVQLCPNLEVLDHSKFDDKYRKQNRILIERKSVVVADGSKGAESSVGDHQEEEEKVSVSYRVGRPMPSRPFDPMRDVFD